MIKLKSPLQRCKKLFDSKLILFVLRPRLGRPGGGPPKGGSLKRIAAPPVNDPFPAFAGIAFPANTCYILITMKKDAI